MGKILLIEPRKVMQQAIVLSLFPEHETEVMETCPESGATALKDFDLIIVDASALRDADKLGPGQLRSVQNWKIPTLWLEDNESGRVPNREKLVVVKKPIELEALRSALASFLYPQSAALGQKEAVSKKTSAGEKKSAESSDAESVIELVEVVDERVVRGERPSAHLGVPAVRRRGQQERRPVAERFGVEVHMRRSLALDLDQ